MEEGAAPKGAVAKINEAIAARKPVRIVLDTVLSARAQDRLE
jgi:hypothetical protein